MKLFYFRPTSYDREALVCAENEAAARAALLATKRPVTATATDVNARWHNETIDFMLALDGFTLEVHEPGQVVFTERN